MKARIKATGEVVNIESYTYSVDKQSIYAINYTLEGVFMATYAPNFEIIKDVPMFMGDFGVRIPPADLPTEPEPTDIDWEQRRWEASVAAMQGLSNCVYYGYTQSLNTTQKQQ